MMEKSILLIIIFIILLLFYSVIKWWFKEYKNDEYLINDFYAHSKGNRDEDSW